MKNRFRLIGIIALFAMFGILILSCDKQNNGITAKYRFSGNRAGTGRSLTMQNVTLNTVIEGADEMESFYDLIGPKITSITPAMLELAVEHLIIQRSDGHTEWLLGGDGGAPKVVDLTKPITISASGIEPGEYKFLRFYFAMTGLVNHLGEVTSMVSFRMPSEIFATPINFNNANISHEGLNTKVPLQFLDPYIVDRSFIYELHGINQIGINPIGNILMGGNSYKIIGTGVSGFSDDNIVPGMSIIVNEGDIIVPFSGINIPEDAAAVRFEIYWDVDGIIEYYSKEIYSNNYYYMILKNKFWEAFSIQAFIE